MIDFDKLQKENETRIEQLKTLNALLDDLPGNMIFVQRLFEYFLKLEGARDVIDNVGLTAIAKPMQAFLGREHAESFGSILDAYEETRPKQRVKRVSDGQYWIGGIWDRTVGSTLPPRAAQQLRNKLADEGIATTLEDA
jgi:hypothetical protein